MEEDVGLILSGCNGLWEDSREGDELCQSGN